MYAAEMTEGCLYYLSGKTRIGPGDKPQASEDIVLRCKTIPYAGSAKY